MIITSGSSMDRDSIRAIAMTVLRRMVGCFDEGDEVSVDMWGHGVRVVYTSSRASRNSDDVTQLKCRADFQKGQMWVDDLRVASRLRANGLGRQLVAAAEKLAADLGLRALSAFPLVSATRFWTKMGYTSHPTTARVVKKDITKICSITSQSSGPNDSGSACR